MKTVLVFSEDQILGEVIGACLIHLGKGVIVSQSVQELLIILQGMTPEFLIYDTYLGAEGAQYDEVLRKLNGLSKVVILTAETKSKLPDEVFKNKLKADLIIRKPFGLEALEELVR